MSSLLILCLASCLPVEGDSASPGCTLPETDWVTRADEILVEGEGPAANGRFDPSPVTVGEEVFMSYSVVDGTSDGELLVHTSLARSADGGDTWTHVVDVNRNDAVSFESALGTHSGVLNHEVSSLLHDPADSAGRAWKIFTHTYLVSEVGTEYGFGYLALWTAPDPEGPWAGPEPLIGWESGSSFTEGQVMLGDIPGMEGCLIVTEPGALLREGGDIDLALSCWSEEEETMRIELLRSSDHAQSWRRVGTLATGADGESWGHDGAEVSAGHLFEQDGQGYVIVTPRGPVYGGSDGYRGCYVLPLGEDGLTSRCEDGRAEVVRVLDVEGAPFTGACAWTPGLSFGYLVPIVDLDAMPDVFHMYRSGVQAP